MSAKPEVILGLSRKFMESRIFLTAAELDVFTLLAKNPTSRQGNRGHVESHDAGHYDIT